MTTHATSGVSNESRRADGCVVVGLATLLCGGCSPTSADEVERPRLQASRTTCVSPCTVMLSIDGVQDASVDNPFVDLGVYWDYDDAASGELEFEHGAARFLGDGASRTYDVNTPLGMHTYVCGRDRCTFRPRVRIQNPAGELVTDAVTIEVRGQDAAFPGEQTVCVSEQGRWDGDEACPPNAQRVSQLPSLQTWSSNTRYLLRRGETFPENCLPYDIENVMIASFGPRELPLPVLTGDFGIGREGNCADALPSRTDFQTPGWVRNIVLTNLRVQEVSLGMAFRDITLHRLDMDWEQFPRGGRIRATSTDACSRRADLDCEDIPLPRGMYITDTRIIGSRQTLPGLNIEFLSSSCVSFFGVMNTETRVAFEHNIRLECGSRVLVMHNDVNGEHLGDRGPKNGITIRPEGHNADDMLDQMRRDTTRGFGHQYENKFVVIKDNYLGMPGAQGSNAARITVAPTKAEDAESTFAAVVTGNVTDLSQDATPDNDIVLSGRGLACYDDNLTQTPGGCSDGGRGSIPDNLYAPARLGIPVPPAPVP